MVFKIPYHYHGADLQEVIYTCMHSIPLQLSTNPQGKEIEEKLFQLTDPITGIFKYLKPDICYRRYSNF
jgi:hypothetical protein